MAADPVTAYQSSLQKLESARSAVAIATEMICMAGAALKLDPLRVMFSNTGDIMFPDGVALLAGAPCINASSWPDGMRLAKLVSDYHAAISDVTRLHQAIPAESRNRVYPPPAR